MFNKNPQLTQQVIDTLCIIISYPEVEDLEDDSPRLQEIALGLITCLSINLHKKKIYLILFEKIQKLLIGD